MSAEIVKLGTLCIDSWPVESGTKCNSDSSPLAIVNTVPGKEIQWVQVGGLLIADRCVCTNISWSRLAKLGYISGKLLQIDGKKFFCRSLKLGNAPDKPSEWDRILDLTGEDDRLWHWKNRCSWARRRWTEPKTNGLLWEGIAPAVGATSAKLFEVSQQAFVRFWSL